ncbi:MAG: ACT domain-containing protein [Oscillospiraceae bacterium]|nr:ACT domain-containing protein [Oscillospiraceae bacterium]
MKAIVTVVGIDRVGIIGEVCTTLAGLQINIVDISQTVMQEFFTMIMLVDTTACPKSFDEVADTLTAKGEEMGLSIRIQRQDIFQAMHRI